MKRIGMLGGMSWESSLEYYRNINTLVKDRLGGAHSADCLMYSFDFDRIEKLQNLGRWHEISRLMIQEAGSLKLAGAEFIVLCSNTIHRVASDIERETGLKVIHIADATADEIIRRRVRRVLLLGTKFTMEGDDYRRRLESRNIEVVIPNETDRSVIHNIIFNELVRGVISRESRLIFVEMISKAEADGVEGVVLGCTEIPLLISQKDVRLQVFNTTGIHSKSAVEYALSEGHGR